MAGLPTAGFFDVLGDLAKIGIGSIPGVGPIITGGLDLLTGGGPQRPFVPLTGCQPGFRRDAQGRCVKEGFIGTIERFLPGGETGLQLNGDGQPLLAGAQPPTVVPSQTLRCPRGMVLAIDNLCYLKQLLPRRSKLRKWRGAPRPPISAADWKRLRVAERVKDKAKDIADTAGFTCRSKGSAPRKKRA